MLGETMVAVIPAYEPGVTLLSIAQEIRCILRPSTDGFAEQNGRDA